MKIRKIILTLATLLATGSAAAAGLGTGAVPAIYPGATVTVPVTADLPQGTSALQFTVTLPPSFTMRSLDVNKDAAPDHLSRVFQENDSTFNYVLYSNANTPFAAGADYLFGIKVRVESDAAPADYTMKIGNIIASDASGEETRLDDVALPVPVYVKVTKVTVEPARATLAPGETLQLAASVQPSDAVQDVIWQSSDPEVVSVDENGLASGLAIGSVRITARSKIFPDYYGYCDISVAAVKATSIVLDKESIDLRMGATATLKATVSPENTTDPSVVWASSDNSIVIVDENGNLTPVKAGMATVTVSTTDGSSLKASCAVTVLPPLATAVTLSNESLELTVMESAKLTASVLPADASQAVEWKSSDENIATVAADGTVSALATGTATISATAADGSGVSASCSVKVNPAKVTSISLSKTALGLRIGQSETITATALPEYAAERTLAWQTDNESVATVDQNGKITAVALGEANITANATDGSGVSALCKVTVTNALASGITIDKTEATLRVRETLKLTATVSPEGAVNAVNWSSSAPEVAAVDGEGNVSALSAGKAIITATTADGTALTATCAITVEPALAESVTIDKNVLDLRVGESAVLVATVLPEYAGNRSVEWSTSDAKIATVAADGTVVATGAGSATITATAADGSGVSASCQVNVSDAKVTSITLDKVALGLRIGQSETIVATVLPDYAGNRTLAWTSDNESVATVDAAGKVTAVALGEAKVTAAATDGSGVTAVCKVTVTNALASAIAIDKTEATLRVRESLKLTATVSPEGAVNAVNWSSSASDVATVDADGNVVAQAVGKAVITAATADGTGLTANCVVTVEPALVESVVLDRHELTMNIGQSETLTASVLPDYAGNQAVIWQSSAPGVAIVDSNGRVIAMAEGSAVVTATAADGSGAFDQCVVTVERIRATSIVVDPQELTIEQGDTVQVKVIVLPADADAGIVWSSLNPAIATVDADGNIAGVEIGTAVITATTNDGSNLTATCLVTVTESTGIAYIECAAGAVTVENGSEIVVRGVADSAIVRVVNTAGACAYCGTARRIGGLAPGLYIVVVENTATKVILR